MEMWQIICLSALVLAIFFIIILIKNLRMMKKIWEEQSNSEEESRLAKKKENLTKSQEIFIGDMAHEMKTPLTAILAFAEILSVKTDITDEERRTYSEYIYEEAVRLKDMSEKLLQLVRFQGTNLEKKVISLKDVIQEVLTAECLICEKEGIAIESRLCEGSLKGERDLLKSLFYNLIDNARKASKENGKILVSMENDRKKIKVQVIDYGMGIPKEEIGNIMKPFYIVGKAVSKKQRGTGLGLSLCRRIIDFHNGGLEIKSQIGKGSIFTVYFSAEG